MVLRNSTLALAAGEIASSLDAALAEVSVAVDTPAATFKAADRGTSTTHFLNMFIYRILPSGVHAAQTPTDLLMLRLFVLFTPFPKAATPDEDFPALRILGEVMRHFHENPVTQILVGPERADGTAGTDYRLQAIPQAPNMEELNHIWTTQGSELSYQLSAAYEFALMPVDPLVQVAETPRIETTQLQVDLMPPVPPGTPPLSDSLRAFSQTGESLPLLLWRGPDGLTNTGSFPRDQDDFDLILTGPPGSRVRIDLRLLRANGTARRSAEVEATVQTTDPNDPAAVTPITLNTNGGRTLIAELVALDAAGAPRLPLQVAATLTLTKETA